MFRRIVYIPVISYQSCIVSFILIESCLPGRFSTTGYAPCQLCPNNFYQSSRGQTECEPCPEEHGTQYKGSTSLSDCIAGKFCFTVFSLDLKFHS